MSLQKFLSAWDDHEENDRIFKCLAPVVCRTKIVAQGFITCETRITSVAYHVNAPLETCKIQVFGKWVPWSNEDNAFIDNQYLVDPDKIVFVIEEEDGEAAAAGRQTNPNQQ